MATASLSVLLRFELLPPQPFSGTTEMAEFTRYTIVAALRVQEDTRLAPTIPMTCRTHGREDRRSENWLLSFSFCHHLLLLLLQDVF